MCFDACPVHACLPHVSRRIKAVTPDAKIIVMLRNPVQGVFSAEVREQRRLVHDHVALCASFLLTYPKQYDWMNGSQQLPGGPL